MGVTMKLLTVLSVMISLLISGTVSGCASAPVRSFTPADYEVVPNSTQRGLASWYGPGYRGKPTASGEKFNPDDFTAAHNKLRFGTIIEVRNLSNNRTVLVEINDRGPSVKGRIIDLSEAAAKSIGMVGVGVTQVEIRTLRKRSD